VHSCSVMALMSATRVWFLRATSSTPPTRAARPAHRRRARTAARTARCRAGLRVGAQAERGAAQQFLRVRRQRAGASSDSETRRRWR
jgi:hypothetical protein